MTCRSVHRYSVWIGKSSIARFRFYGNALEWALRWSATTIRTNGKVIWRREDKP
jgi:hypothetical protein